MDICGRTSLLPGSCVCPSHPTVIGVLPAVPATEKASIGLTPAAGRHNRRSGHAKLTLHGPWGVGGASRCATGGAGQVLFVSRDGRGLQTSPDGPYLPMKLQLRAYKATLQCPWSPELWGPPTDAISADPSSHRASAAAANLRPAQRVQRGPGTA